MALRHVGDDVQAVGLAGLDVERGVHEERSGPPGSGGHLGELPTVSEGCEGVRIEAEPGFGQPGGPDGGGSERLCRFRPVDDQRLHGEDADSGVVDLAAPVGVRKVAQRLLKRHADTPRHHVEQSVDEFDRAGVVAVGVSRSAYQFRTRPNRSDGAQR